MDSQNSFCVWDYEEAEQLASFTPNVSQGKKKLVSFAIAQDEQCYSKDYVALYVASSDTLYRYEIPNSRNGYSTYDPLVAVCLPNGKLYHSSDDPIRLMRVTPNGALVALLHDSYMTNLQVKNFKKRYSHTDGKFDQVALFDNGKQAMVAVTNRTEKSLAVTGDISVIVPGGKRIVLTWHPTKVHDIQFSSDGNYLYSGGGEGMAVLWNLSTSKKDFFFCNSPVRFLNMNDLQDRLVVVTQLNRLLIVNPRDEYKKQQLANLSSFEPVSAESKNIVPHELTIDPLHNHVLMAGSSTIQWYDVRRDTVVRELPVYTKAVHFNSSRFGDSKPLSIVSQYLAFNVDGSLLASVDTTLSDKIETWVMKFYQFSQDSNSYKLVSVVDEPHTAAITDMAFHPVDRNLLVTCSLDKSARIWKCDQNIFLCTMVMSLSDIEANSASFSRDGSIIAIAFGEALTFWDLQQGEMIHECYLPILQKDVIQKVRFTSPDNHLVVLSKSSIVLFSLTLMKPEWSLQVNEVMSSCFHTSSGQFAVLIHDETKNSQLLVFDAKKSNALKRVVPISQHVRTLGFMDDATIVMMNESYEICAVSLSGENIVPVLTSNKKTPSSSKKGSEQQKLNQYIREQSELLQRSVSQTQFAFDPERGMGSWKKLFATTSHSLASTTTLFKSYMEHFVLKSGMALEREDTMATRANELDSEQQEWLGEKKPMADVVPPSKIQSVLPSALASFLHNYAKGVEK